MDGVGRPGQLRDLDYNEALNKDGTLDRNAQTTHTYGRYQHQECILSGATNEVFEPRFTYHAFRYVEFRGLDRAPGSENLVVCRLHTQLRRTSSFECSDPQLNQLHAAARRDARRLHVGRADRGAGPRESDLAR